MHAQPPLAMLPSLPPLMPHQAPIPPPPPYPHSMWPMYPPGLPLPYPLSSPHAAPYPFALPSHIAPHPIHPSHSHSAPILPPATTTMSIVSLNQTLTAVLVDTPGLLQQCLADLYPTPMTGTVTVSVDLEGINLSRFGKICVLQIMRAYSNMVWLIDVTTLGRNAFEDMDPRGINLKYILECTEVEKLFFDVRNDSDALYSLYGIALSNVYDLQILELAVRLSNGRRVNLITGLRRAIQEFLIPPQDWVQVKDTGTSLFAPEKGGSYEVFDTRPLDPRLIAYCAQDVTLLYVLRESMLSRMGTKGADWERRICNESFARVFAATQPAYQPDGPHKIMAPRCW